MLFYPVARPDVTPSGAEDAGSGLPGQAGMVAVRVADLASPAGPGLGRDGRSALVVAGWSAATGGCRPPGTRLITPGSGWPRRGSMPWPDGGM